MALSSSPRLLTDKAVTLCCGSCSVHNAKPLDVGGSRTALVACVNSTTSEAAAQRVCAGSCESIVLLHSWTPSTVNPCEWRLRMGLSFAYLSDLSAVTLLQDPPKSPAYITRRIFNANGPFPISPEQCELIQDSSGIALPFVSAQCPPRLHCVFSYSLYGNDARYLNGAVENAKLVHLVFPGWQVRMYTDMTVPQPIIEKLQALKAEVILSTNLPSDVQRAKMSWRFLVADDPAVDVYAVRDSDSRLSWRERAAIADWLERNVSFHVMRDHQNHNYAMSGGMWGGRKGENRLRRMLAMVPPESNLHRHKPCYVISIAHVRPESNCTAGHARTTWSSTCRSWLYG